MVNKPVVLIAEHRKQERVRLSALLDGGGYRVLPATDGREALSIASSHCPDLVLLSLDLPDQRGVEVLQSIRAWSSVPVIALSSCSSCHAEVSALDGGADDFVCIPCHDDVLMARVRTTLRKYSSVSTESCFELDGLMVDFGRRNVFKHGRQVHLTPIEYKMLVVLAANAGKALTHQDIRREIWGPYAGDNRLLRVNMANLRRKIEDDPSSPRYILTELGFGYRMIDRKKNSI